jgi:hypothetical protein
LQRFGARHESRGVRVSAFLITIDTEGDDLWSRPRHITTRNAAFVSRFQRLCEEFGFKPTWLVNHEMARSAEFVAFGWDVLERGTGEIGMHLHAWNSPPKVALTRDDMHHQPFLTDYPDDVMEAKVDHLTRLLRARFGPGVISHRGGRWAMDARYARLLVRYGYRVDCSVTPGVDWSTTPGAPAGRGGPDYREFPQRPYRVDLDHIERAGDSPLLEVPMSVMPSALCRRLPWAYSLPGVRRFAWRHRPPQQWLYPDGRNLRDLCEVMREAHRRRACHLEMVLHSSELMPAGAPSLPDEASIERLYADLRAFFTLVAPSWGGMTLSEFRDRWWREHVERRDRRQQVRGAERRQRILAFIPRDRRATTGPVPSVGPA